MNTNLLPSSSVSTLSSNTWPLIANYCTLPPGIGVMVNHCQLCHLQQTVIIKLLPFLDNTPVTSSCNSLSLHYGRRDWVAWYIASYLYKIKYISLLVRRDGPFNQCSDYCSSLLEEACKHLLTYLLSFHLFHLRCHTWFKMLLIHGTTLVSLFSCHVPFRFFSQNCWQCNTHQTGGL